MEQLVAEGGCERASMNDVLTKQADFRLWCPNTTPPSQQRSNAVMLLLTGKRVEFHTHPHDVGCPGFTDLALDDEGVMSYPDTVCWSMCWGDGE
jgi:hypothetical protein